jgi:Leucine-rich repeat (LRR) protein
LTEIVQNIGRTTRDAPGKTRARFANLIAEPDASEDAVTEAVNDTLKAIAASLLMEQVLAPRFEFRPKNPTNTATPGLDYGPNGYDPNGRNIGVNRATGTIQRGACTYRQCRNLESLSLAETKISDQGLALLKDLKHLKWLKLEGSKSISGEGLIGFQGQELHYLDLSGTKIDDRILERLFEFKSLRTLWLRDTCITDVAVRRIGALAMLEELHLDGCKAITDKGVSWTSELGNLKRLCLSGTKVSDETLLRAEKMSNLKELEVYGTAISKEGVARLRKHRPDLKIRENTWHQDLDKR